MKTKILLLCGLILAGISCKKDKQSPYPTSGLISYFNFDDNLKDQKGYTSDGVKTGTPPYIVGVIGKAVSFNGIDQKIVFSPKKSTSTNCQMSVACWFKTTNTDRYFIQNSIFRLSTTLLGKVRFTVSPGSTNNAQGTFTANEWTHVIGTYDGVEIKIYINGVLNQTIAKTDDTANTSDLILGSDNLIYWAGSIDELYIYNRPLSQAEVTQLYTLK